MTSPGLSTDMYLSIHTPAGRSGAFSHIAQPEPDRVAIDELEGRITTSRVTPYPPGIRLQFRVFNSTDTSKFNREFAADAPASRHSWFGAGNRQRRRPSPVRG
jgi:hypothetical protein